MAIQCFERLHRQIRIRKGKSRIPDIHAVQKRL